MKGHILTYRGVSPRIADDVFVAPGAVVIGDVELGSGSSVWFGAVIRGDYGPICIGSNVSVQDNAVVHVFHAPDAQCPTVIGDDVTIGHGAVVEGCTIGAGTVIGMNAVVLPRASVGARCMVGAGAVVSQGKSFEDGSLIAGVPAERKREMAENALLWNRFATEEYARLSQEYRAELGQAVNE